VREVPLADLSHMNKSAAVLLSRKFDAARRNDFDEASGEPAAQNFAAEIAQLSLPERATP
jgi:hypothetical protein